ncbi:hypothetical protein BNJ_00355 [Kaumoebavirus]|uniref:hypothetical protein n=1 Tax=Kaumoebavirus TaxID=1859492 RepID=UPI0009C35FED|nr:hypothetical protein BNJ_00355 [Kaumoebavirus]ARA72175.1 hypothetical protein BNJ_00355 [Kaumoebavirus]
MSTQPQELTNVPVVGDLLPNDFAEISIFNDKGVYYLSVIELTSPFFRRFRVAKKNLPEQIKVDVPFVHFVALTSYDQTLIVKRLESVPPTKVDSSAPLYNYIDTVYGKLTAQSQQN